MKLSLLRSTAEIDTRSAVQLMDQVQGLIGSQGGAAGQAPAGGEGVRSSCLTLMLIVLLSDVAAHYRDADC